MSEAIKEVRAHKQLTYLLCTGGLLAIQTLVFVWFYPAYLTIYDESVYLSMAFAYQHGSIFGDNYPALIGATPVANHWVFKFPPGLPLLILAFSQIRWEYAFWANYILYALGAFIFSAILRHLNARPHWVLLYLAFPPFVLFSRTLMSDIGSMVCILGAFWLCLDSKLFQKPARQFFSGLLIGISISFRVVNGCMLPAFLIWFFLSRRPWKFFLAGMASACFPLLMYFAALGFPPSGDTRGQFTLSVLPAHLLLYLTILCCLYPGLMPSLLVRVKGSPRGAIGGITAVIVLLYSCWYFVQPGTTSWVASLVAASRFILAAQALLLIHYAAALDNLWNAHASKLGKMRQNLGLCLVILMLAGGTVSSIVISKEQQKRCQSYLELSKLVEARAMKDAVLLANHDGLKCFNPYTTTKTQYLLTFEGFPFDPKSPSYGSNVVKELRKNFPGKPLQTIVVRRQASNLEDLSIHNSRVNQEESVLSALGSGMPILKENVDIFSIEMRTYLPKPESVKEESNTRANQ